MFKKIINNHLIHYVLSRYFTYFIQFLNSLFIAVKLGPFYLGVWGFISLIVQYFNQINFGIPYSVNAIMAINKDNNDLSNKIYNNSIILVGGLGIFVFLVYLSNIMFGLQIGYKYGFDKYFLIVCVIGCLNYFMSLFSNIFRIYGKLFEIAFSQSILPLLMLVCVVFYKGDSLLNALIFANLIAFALSVLLYIKNSPLRFRFEFDVTISKTIMSKGLYLFIYNASFYLIVISTRTLISGNYSISEFGVFTFAFSLGNVILLLLESFSFLLFPKILKKLHGSNNEDGRAFLDKIRVSYTTISHFIVHLALFLFPFFLFLFPKYTTALISFRLIALTLVLFTNSFGYQGLLIARNKERNLGIIALLALLLNIILGAIIIFAFKLGYEYVIVATTITYLVYSTVVSYFGNRVFGEKLNIIQCFFKIAPLSLLLPYILSFILTILKVEGPYYFILPIILFIIMNLPEYDSIKGNLKNVLNNPKITDV